jgi:uncharacterized protein
MAGETLHEERAVLSKEVLDRHRALSTIMEELEAIDWYDQRIAGSDNAELRAVLTHNRDEEKEHASMLLEWVRRHDPAFARHMGVQLFNPGAIRETAAIEGTASEGKATEGKAPAANAQAGDAQAGKAQAGKAQAGKAQAGKASGAAAGDGTLGIGSLRAAR